METPWRGGGARKTYKTPQKNYLFGRAGVLERLAAEYEQTRPAVVAEWLAKYLGSL